MPLIQQIVSSAFGDSGNGTNLLGQYRQTQEQFADSVNTFLDASDDTILTSVGIIEGTTGVGKTFAYLIPLLCQSVFNGKRVAVATFSRHLQLQFKTDIETVINKLGSILPRKPTIAIRLGSDEYFHLDSIRFFVDNPPTDDEAELAKLKHLFEWQSISENEEHQLYNNSYTGRYSDYLEQHDLYSLPFDLDKLDVSIKPFHLASQKTCYYRDVNRSKAADVIIVTQAMLMLHIKTGAEILNDETDIDYLVIDESDKIPVAAESIFTSGFSLNLYKSHFETLANSSIHFHEVYDRYSHALEYLSFLEMDHSDSLVIDTDNPKHANIVNVIRDLSKSLSKSLANNVVKSSVHFDCVQSLSSFSYELTNFISMLDRCDSSLTLPMIKLSPVYGLPSLVTVPINTGFLTSKLFGSTKDGKRFFKKILFTSATLNSKSDTIDFSAFKIMAGISAAVKAKRAQVLIEKIYKANGFGRISMILSPNSAPKPIYFNQFGEIKYEPSFLRRVVQFAKLSISSAPLQDCGNRTLVLTCSYDETFEIAKVLRAGGLNPIEHEQGIPLRDYLTEFRNDSSAILVSCAAWEGFDERIANTIITRIPFVHLGSIFEQKINFFVSKGFNEKIAANIIQKQLRFDTQRKLAQGIGRVIRRSGDRGRVMFCDPRVKTFNEKHWAKTLGLKQVTNAYSIQNSLKCDYHLNAWKKATVLTDNENTTIININGEVKT